MRKRRLCFRVYEEAPGFRPGPRTHFIPRLLSLHPVTWRAMSARSYVGFQVDEPGIMPAASHEAVEKALERMTRDGLFRHDVLAAAGSNTRPVSSST